MCQTFKLNLMFEFYCLFFFCLESSSLAGKDKTKLTLQVSLIRMNNPQYVNRFVSSLCLRWAGYGCFQSDLSHRFAQLCKTCLQGHIFEALTSHFLPLTAKQIHGTMTSAATAELISQSCLLWLPPTQRETAGISGTPVRHIIIPYFPTKLLI